MRKLLLFGLILIALVLLIARIIPRNQSETPTPTHTNVAQPSHSTSKTTRLTGRFAF